MNSPMTSSNVKQKVRLKPPTKIPRSIKSPQNDGDIIKENKNALILKSTVIPPEIKDNIRNNASHIPTKDKNIQRKYSSTKSSFTSGNISLSNSISSVTSTKSNLTKSYNIPSLKSTSIKKPIITPNKILKDKINASKIKTNLLRSPIKVTIEQHTIKERLNILEDYDFDKGLKEIQDIINKISTDDIQEDSNLSCSNISKNSSLNQKLEGDVSFGYNLQNIPPGFNGEDKYEEFTMIKTSEYLEILMELASMKQDLDILKNFLDNPTHTNPTNQYSSTTLSPLNEPEVYQLQTPNSTDSILSLNAPDMNASLFDSGLDGVNTQFVTTSNEITSHESTINSSSEDNSYDACTQTENQVLCSGRIGPPLKPYDSSTFEIKKLTSRQRPSINDISFENIS